MSAPACTVADMNKNHPPPGEAPLQERTAARIRGLIAAKNHNKQDLGTALGISRQAAARKLRGEVKLTVPDLEKIAAWLEIDVKELLP